MKCTPEIKKLLPRVKKPLGNYVAVSYANGIGKISGQFPVSNANILTRGKIESEVTVSDAIQASRYTALNIISQIESLENCMSNISLLHIDCYLQASIHDENIIQIADMISSTLIEAYKEQGEHSRSLVIVSDLPFNATMEVVTTFTYN